MLPGKQLFVATLLAIFSVVSAHSEESMFEDFETKPAARWEFIADTVMGGVSTGTVTFEDDGTTAFARLTGSVSTANRGGFIQFRRKLEAPPPDGTMGIRIVVRGNNQRYFLHLRTRGTVLPWQYYHAGFDTTKSWTEIRLPLSSFKASGMMLRKTPEAKSLTSIGVVAFGRDHEAQIDVREIDFY